ncbi:MAG TPA: FAD:protein FMN transferase, partial [Mycobacteriales bacterium]
ARRWAYGAGEMHHLLDSRTGLPARTPWRTVSAAAATCLVANVATTATIVRGESGLATAQAAGLPMRLVSHDDGIVRLGGWPA